MYELTNIRTGVVYSPIDEDEYQSLKENRRLKKFRVVKFEPIKKLIITPRLIEPEVKKTKAKVIQ